MLAQAGLLKLEPRPADRTNMRREFIFVSAITCLALGTLGYFHPGALWAFVVVGPLVVLGIVDIRQTRHTVRRNFPVIGHMRYLLEMIRPEINQYFIESNTDGTPFNREVRSLVYQRAKGE